MVLSRNPKLIHARALHQFINTSGGSSVFNPDDILSKYGSKLTPTKVSTIVKGQHDSEEAYKFFAWARHQRGYKHNGLAYGAIIHSLCRTKHFELLEKVLEELRTEKFSLKVPTFTFILKSMAQEGKVQETLQLFGRMAGFGCEPTLSTYHCVLHMLVKAGCLEEASKVYKEMREANVQPDSVIVGMLTNALCKGEKLDEALTVAESAPGSVDAITLSGLLGCLCKAGRPGDAARFVERMKTFEVTPDSATYNKLVVGFCKLGKVDAAVGILEKMSKESLTPWVLTYNTVLDVLCELARIDEAWQLFKSMSVKPDATSYNIMVNGLCKKRRVAEALTLISEMIDSGYKPTVKTYVWIFHGLFKIGNSRKACDLLHDLKQSGLLLDNTLFNEVVDGLCKGGRVDDACVLLQQMTPDKHTYASIIDGLCKAGRCLEAVEFITDDVSKSGCVLDITVWSPLFKGLCEEGRFDEVMKLYDASIDQGSVLCKTTYNVIIKGLSNAGRLDDISRLMREMQKNVILPEKRTYDALIDGNIQYTVGAADLFKPLVGSNVVLGSEKYTALIDGLFKTGEVQFAMTIFHEMRRVGCKPNTRTYTALIDGLCKLNRLVEAKEFFQSMKEDGCIAESAMFTVLLHGFCRAGQIDEADLLYKEMQEDGIGRDVATYNVLLEGFSGANRLKEVFRVLDDMRVRGCPPNDLGLRFLFGSLSSRDTKRVSKYIKELFGIVYTPETLESNKSVQVKLRKDTKRYVPSIGKATHQNAKKGKTLSKKLIS